MTACDIPIAAMMDNNAEPPLEINNNGTPVNGIRPLTPPTFRKKCKKMYIAVPINIIL